VRQALIIGWNRDDLTKSVLTDSYKPATSVLGSKTIGYSDYSQTALKYDPEKAKQVLDAAGWKPGPDGIRTKDGKKLTIKLLVPNNLLAPNVPAAQLFQAELKKIGIDVALTNISSSEISAQWSQLPTLYNGVLFNTSRQDPSVLGQSFSTGAGNGAHLTTNDPAVGVLDPALTKVDSTLESATRNAAAKEAQDLILEKYFLYNPFYEAAQVYATSPKVHGLAFGALARTYYYNVWLDK
ncbi:MAG: ABC transporter substrate-binding protein, partial [Gordonia sp. (in: high G+C Gram-positive bacteria)]